MRSLQCHINDKTGIVAGMPTAADVETLPQDEKIALREAVYENPGLISDYVRENPHKFDAESLKIIGGWVSFVSGHFYIERYLKNHAIFMDEKNVYAVHGLYDAFDRIIPKAYLPAYVSTVLLPFKGQIVFDGLMFGQNVYFGSNITASLKEDYLRAKQNGRIIDTLPPSNKPAKKSTRKAVDWSREMAQLQKAAKPLKGGAGQPPLNSPAFSLVKSSIELAGQAAESSDPDTLQATFKKVRRAVTQIENILHRME
ncbi:MAG TPA: hypothetical protein PLB10_14375 [Thiolinea sp.]|nr:hypothetical protein [Thiolinea sp.]